MTAILHYGIERHLFLDVARSEFSAKFIEQRNKISQNTPLQRNKFTN